MEIEALFEDPHAYNGKQICTEGMINVEFEGMRIYPSDRQSSPYSHTSLNLYYDMHFGEALDMGLRNRGWFRMEGFFTINEECWITPPYSDKENETFCIPSRPGHLVRPRILLLRRDPARDICTVVALENFAFDAVNWERSIICTHGQIHSMDSEL